MPRYFIGHPGTREPHPDCPPEGFPSATEANLWAVRHDLSAWTWWIAAASDPRPARTEGTL